MVKGYSVTIVGSHSIWSWFIELDRHGVADGMERDFDAAMIAADNEAHRLTDGSGDM